MSDGHRVERVHANGTRAVVNYLEHDGGCYRADVEPLPGGAVAPGHVRTSASLEHAKQKADALAHPGCDGRCAPWPTIDPRGAAPVADPSAIIRGPQVFDRR
jgi:hypothetical protein